MCTPQADQKFPSTHWSLILDADRRQECLEKLATRYWSAIYLYARKNGDDPEKAKDLTQDLFYEILKGDLLEKADPQKGRFRSYLIGILKNLDKRAARRERRRERYEGMPLTLKCSFEPEKEREYLAADISPEDVFNREWARLIVNRALSQLREYCHKDGKSERTQALRGFELRYFDNKKIVDIAQDIQRDVKWISEKVYRLKEKYREYIQNIIQATLTEEENLEDEVRQIMSYLA